jgi:hypothetical protein
LRIQLRRMIFGHLDPDPLVRGIIRIRILLLSSKNSKKP